MIYKAPVNTRKEPPTKGKAIHVHSANKIGNWYNGKQDEIAVWTSIKGNGSVHDGDGTIVHGLTMDIAKGLSIREHMCYLCFAHLDLKAFEQEEEGKSSLPDQSGATKNLPKPYRKRNCYRNLKMVQLCHN